MVKDIIVYPTPPSVEYATDVRFFNEELNILIQNLKDTIIENLLDGLSAYQIGSFYNVIVVKQDDGTLIELINPRLIYTNGKVTTKEITAYFPNLSANVERFENISVIYQDINAQQKSIKASGKFAILLQRKIDYTFGATFLQKLSKEEKKIFEKKLEYGSDVVIPESCPVTSYKDYILKFANVLVAIIALLLVWSFFVSDEQSLQTIWNYQLNISYGVFITSIIYLVYGWYEGKQFSSCTSCQVGNLIGSVVILLIKLTLAMILSYIYS